MTEMFGHRNNITYIRKEYYAKFLFGALRLSLISEDRGNGEYKHMLYVKFFGKPIVTLVFRTGTTTEGVNVSMGYFESNSTVIDYDENRHVYNETDAMGYNLTKWQRGNLQFVRCISERM